MKFRYQGLASRFMSYGQYWDRILRLIDEGKYHRHTSKIKPPEITPLPSQISPKEEAVRLQKELSEARKALGLSGSGPSTDSVEVFLAAQREKSVVATATNPSRSVSIPVVTSHASRSV